jgi:hypothetical protein
VEGRPPEEIVSSAGTIQRWSNNVASRCETVDRARPVSWTSSARVRAWPSRRIESSAPGESANSDPFSSAVEGYGEF